MGELAVDHMRFMHHVINYSWLITAHAQCAVISQREHLHGTRSSSSSNLLLYLLSGKLKDVQL